MKKRIETLCRYTLVADLADIHGLNFDLFTT